ncbi:MAG: family 20 glycosylhydrolase [Victivallaceae bacterium]
MKISITIALLLLTGGLFAEILTPQKCAGFNLIPVPKKVITDGTIQLANRFKVEGDFPAVKQLLNEELTTKYGWLEANDGELTRIVLKISPELKRNEEFELDFAADLITVKAAGIPGFFAAAGRLFNLLESRDVVHRKAGVGLTVREISDWPDMPKRGMFLQMAFVANQAQFDSLRRSIDLMRRLGYNFAVFDIGGRFDSKYPGLTLPNGWKNAQLKELIGYAARRGIKVYPSVNSIGHPERSIQLYPLTVNHKKIGQDITQPDFYRQYLAVLDELCDLFNNPEYFLIGTDESQAVFAHFRSRGEKPDELYLKHLSNVAAHLKKRNIKPVIWHDMLITKAEAAKMEPANAEATESVRNRLPENMVIDYWCYDPVAANPGLDKLLATRREIWVSPWNSRPGTRRLMNQARQKQINTLLATSWNGVDTDRSAFVDPIELAWNQASEVDFSAKDIFNHFFSRRPEIRAAEVTALPVELPEGTALSGQKDSLSAAGITFPLNRGVSSGHFQRKTVTTGELCNAAKDQQIYLLSPENPHAGMRLDGINASRGTRQAIVYLPNYGANSRTNQIGLEWIFENGKIVKFNHGSFEGGSSPIPASGGVLSVHDFSGPKSIFMRSELNPGAPVEFIAIAAEKLPASGLTLRCPLRTDAEGAILLLSSDFLPMGENQILAVIRELYPDGTRREIPLRSDFTDKLSLLSQGALRCWIAGRERNPVVAFEWRRSAGSRYPAALELEITPEGRKFNFNLRSAVEY